jgi:hypothetical protein
MIAVLVSRSLPPGSLSNADLVETCADEWKKPALLAGFILIEVTVKIETAS